MSLCRTCEYALYDGMCMAHGKFTLLDAPACDDYKMHLDVEVSKLKAENARLREAVKRMHEHIRQTCGECDGWYCSNFDEDNECCVYDTLARELGVETTE